MIIARDSLLLIDTWFEWQVGPKDHQRFQSSYATILKARMTALKKRERKDKRKTADSDKKQDQKKQSKPSNKTGVAWMFLFLSFILYEYIESCDIKKS